MKRQLNDVSVLERASARSRGEVVHGRMRAPQGYAVDLDGYVDLKLCAHATVLDISSSLCHSNEAPVMRDPHTLLPEIFPMLALPCANL